MHRPPTYPRKRRQNHQRPHVRLEKWCQTQLNHLSISLPSLLPLDIIKTTHENLPASFHSLQLTSDIPSLETRSKGESLSTLSTQPHLKNGRKIHISSPSANSHDHGLLYSTVIAKVRIRMLQPVTGEGRKGGIAVQK